VPDSLLRILNGALLVLLLLFFLRVLRAVWVQVNAPPLPPVAPPVVAPSPQATGGRGTGGRGTAQPTVARHALRLRIIDPPDRRGQTYDLSDEMTVGRAPGCGVSITDATVSQLHARLFRRDGRLYLEDLGSTNGTWLNKARVSAPVPLKRGDRVQLGSTVLEVTR
jgi:hypothetical protein